MKKVVMLATTNKGKIKEISRMLSQYNIEILIPDRNLEVQEGSCSFLENAYEKARAYYEVYSVPTLADDSGLVIPSLDNFPGVFSSRFYNHPFGGIEELRGSQDETNIKKVLRLLKNKEDRRAYFICYVVLYTASGGFFAEGKVEGVISNEPRGTNGFGYDPIFLPNGYDRSMAELTPQEKDKISHRGKAIVRLLEVMGWT